ncbi:uncharacterized protein LOC133718739 [Rosa rugosa]|uniref:uncharacterized protein LOC133718739 n=1 Tax=Rosa rugosa TaxID=74645 RepID=UPI002B4179CC|nr:uncharacterized protein LOC133718739 [Rosa rugosa]
MQTRSGGGSVAEEVAQADCRDSRLEPGRLEGGTKLGTAEDGESLETDSGSFDRQQRSISLATIWLERKDSLAGAGQQRVKCLVNVKDFSNIIVGLAQVNGSVFLSLILLQLTENFLGLIQIFCILCSSRVRCLIKHLHVLKLLKFKNIGKIDQEHHFNLL